MLKFLVKNRVIMVRSMLNFRTKSKLTMLSGDRLIKITWIWSRDIPDIQLPEYPIVSILQDVQLP